MRGFLQAGGVNPEDIGIIAAYNAQCQLLHRFIPEIPMIGSVDAFQGQERRLIILSLVRTNSCNAAGFWNEARRLNVALTRAQQGLIIVGDACFWSQTTAHFNSFMKHISKEELLLNMRASTVQKAVSVNPRSAQSHPRSAQEGMNSSQASSIQGGIRVRLSAVDKMQCVEDIQRLLEAFTSHAMFQPILEYMMSLKEHTWRVQEIPDDVWSWDQKCWSHLCTLTRTGMQDDPGNRAYGVSVIVLAQFHASIPKYSRLWDFADTGALFDMNGMCRSNEKKLMERAGDILGAIGGAVTWEEIAGREFCEYYRIAEDSAKELLSLLSGYLQKITLFISSADASTLGAIVEELLTSMGKHGSKTRKRTNTDSCSSTPLVKKTKDVHGTDSEMVRQTSAASSHSTPYPKLFWNDNRFDKNVRKRLVYCDSCYQEFQYKPLGFDGQYVHTCDAAEGKKLKTDALEAMYAAYMSGSWNATWMCSKCWLATCNSEHGCNYSLQDIRTWLGIDIAWDKELARKQARTQDGTWREKHR